VCRHASRALASSAATSWKGRFGRQRAATAARAGLRPQGLEPTARRWTWSLCAHTPRRCSRATDAHLAAMMAEDLARPLDLSRFGFGQQPVLFVLTALLGKCRRTPAKSPVSRVCRG